MLIAKDETFQQIIQGSEVTSRNVVQSKLHCPICGGHVEYSPSAEHPLTYFSHSNGEPDCFATEKESYGHRLAVEAAAGAMWNRIAEVTGQPETIDIDIERRVGKPSKFVITDVRVSSPVQIAAEVFYQVNDLALRRRLNTLSEHDYRAFLIFHSGGTHDIRRIDRYMQRLSSFRVGRFDPGPLRVDLGDLFSRDRINLSAGSDVPSYMISG